MIEQSHWAWLIAGALLASAEMLVPGVYLIWIGAAAFLTGIVALLLPIGLPAELTLFAIAAVGSVLGSLRFTRRASDRTEDPLLNERTARLTGRIVVVAQAISGGEGRVHVGDGEWPASGPDAAVGEKVRIIGAEGTRLRVERLP